MDHPKTSGRSPLGGRIRAALILAAGLVVPLSGVALLAAPQVTPSTPRDRAGRQVSLYDQLRVGLKAITEEDFAYIDLVVLRVRQRALPRSLVDSTFLWARYRYRSRPGSHRLRPMVYFRPAMTLRARRIGVLL